MDKRNVSTEEKDENNFLIVVAIDFGTSYSGYAYSVRSEFLTDPSKVFANEVWNAGPTGLFSLKTPTCVLLDDEKKMVAFGYDAENKYAELLSKNEQRSFYFFERFKMKLYESFLYEEIFGGLLEAINSLHQLFLNILTGGRVNVHLPSISPFMTLTELGGKKLPAADIFTLSIKALVDNLLSELNLRGHTDFSIKDIKWVLTVPAIWSVRAKRFMRNSAIQAGIPDKNLIIALEPECASVFCQYIPTKQLTGKDSTFSAGNIGTKYMVVDLGGGTADIAVHEKLEGQKLKELCRAVGGDCGGTSVDKAFQSLLQKVFGLQVMEDMQKKDLESFFIVKRNFEAAKRKVLPDSTGTITLDLCYVTLQSLCKEHHDKTLEEVIKNDDELSDKITVSKGHFKIDVGVLKTLFQPTLDKLIYVLMKVFENKRVKDVENIVLVGGFAESKLVQSRIKDSFPTKRVIVPERSSLVVVKGAVMYGHLPSYISVRVTPFTYGIMVSKSFDELIHDQRHAFIKNGKKYCRNLFEKLIERDVEVQVGSKIVKELSTSVPFQNFIFLKMYISKSTNPKYVDDEDCAFAGSSHLTVSNPTQGQQSVKVFFGFGDTEINIEVENTCSGSKSEVIIDDETEDDTSDGGIPDIFL